MMRRLWLIALALPAALTSAAPGAAQSGLVMQLNNSASVARLKVDTAGGFLALGTFGVGTIPATGAGIRMMWYPGKAAFRVGKADATQWDDTNIGTYSFAAGYNAKATGTESAAFGEGTASNHLAFAAISGTASGNDAVAIGSAASAAGNHAIALGLNATADSTYTLAIGNSATATGYAATALGFHGTASGNYSVALGSYVSTDAHEGAFFYGDHSTGTTVGTSSVNNQFAVRAQHVWLGTSVNASNTAGHFIDTSTGAYLSTGGTWTNGSSRLWKDGFKPIDANDALRRIAALPVTRWNYKADPASTQHIGPVAEDFFAAFHLGDSDRHIAPSDMAGVSLLGIQALERRTRELERENAALQARLDRLEEALQRLESR